MNNKDDYGRVHDYYSSEHQTYFKEYVLIKNFLSLYQNNLVCVEDWL